MSRNGHLIAIIGTMHPAIFDVVFPPGSLGGEGVAVRDARRSPSLPEREIFRGIRTGAEVAHQLVRSARSHPTATVAGTPRSVPQPYPWRSSTDDSEFARGYRLGVGAVLEATAMTWRQAPAADFLARLYRRVARTAPTDRIVRAG